MMTLHRSAATTAARRKPQDSRSRRRAPAPVTTTRVHPDAWQTALRLAVGDRHVEVESPAVVYVRNGVRR